MAAEDEEAAESAEAEAIACLERRGEKCLSFRTWGRGTEEEEEEEATLVSKYGDRWPLSSFLPL